MCRKIGGQSIKVRSGQAIKLFHTPRKISFTFHFWHKSFILHDVKLADSSYLTTVLKERLKDRDISGAVGQNILCILPTYSHWVRSREPQPPWTTPLIQPVKSAECCVGRWQWPIWLELGVHQICTSVWVSVVVSITCCYRIVWHSV